MSEIVYLRPEGSEESIEFTVDPAGTRLGDLLARATAEQGILFNNVAVGIRRANGEAHVDFPSAEQAKESDVEVEPGDEVNVSRQRNNG